MLEYKFVFLAVWLYSVHAVQDTIMGEDKIVSCSYLSVCSMAVSMHTRPGVQECRLADTFITLQIKCFHGITI